MARILAVDPGSKRLGIAVSDPQGVIAGPYGVINHISRQKDAENIVGFALNLEVITIVVGLATTSNGEISPSGRSAQRLAAVIQSLTDIPVVLWDESGSTIRAKETVLEMGKSRKFRRGHHDQLAAVLILQDYLENLRDAGMENREFNFGDL